MCVKKSLLKHVLSDSLLLRFKLLAKKDNCTLHTVDKVRKLGGKIRRWRRDLALSHLPTFSYCCCATLNLWLGLMQPLYLTKLATLTPFSGCLYYLCLECKKNWQQYLFCVVAHHLLFCLMSHGWCAKKVHLLPWEITLGYFSFLSNLKGTLDRTDCTRV